MSSDRIEYWSRGRRGKLHAFTCSVGHMSDGEPRYDMLSLCERHEFTLDREHIHYEPWFGDDYPADALVCKKCRAVEATS